MPQLLVLALVGAGVVAGYRLGKRLAAAPKVDQATSKDNAADPSNAAAETRNMGQLVKDPASGQYRPNGSTEGV